MEGTEGRRQDEGRVLELEAVGDERLAGHLGQEGVLCVTSASRSHLISLPLDTHDTHEEMEEYQVEVERDGVVLFVVQDQVAIAADHAHHGVGTVLALSTITNQPTNPVSIRSSVPRGDERVGCEVGR
jgi:hypothetical protein